ncbi:uncharacterized protein LOC131691288 [Topomyia yanbarensis]|uniref:uncharacterized protein LOC131691288 n=1 Tax=Topomyia yanbarensis TaxID=2498891 RepID=UPI00273C6F4B|nr:uncharacterized protein LOC131691288 [Topomyia yanbarensis]
MRHASVWVCILTFYNLQSTSLAAIVPPPWSDPNKNPCASQPGGWQLLYWPPLRKCFKIFQMGYPCPDTMELSPVGVGSTSMGSSAECRCPPGTAQHPLTRRCHRLFERGPCDFGQYFAPFADSEVKSAIPKQRWGTCKSTEICDSGMIFWPQDNKCYQLYTKGPCSKGKLISMDNDGIAKCKCEKEGELGNYFHNETETCHEFFTKGPCQRTGELFLPSRKCACHQRLPHYHNETSQCYELDTIGPCPIGHTYIIADKRGQHEVTAMRAECRCKENYVPWKNGYCYKLYTQGPCDFGSFIIDSNSCIPNPCEKGRLYFPREKTCYRIGAQGPCSLHQVVIFDFTTRPSLDGISYNGICGCSGVIHNLDQTCSEDDVPKSACDSTPDMIEINKQCFKLYTRGPCGPGQWIEPKKGPAKIRAAACVCRPGYTTYDTPLQNGVIGCQPPAVGLARYLNGKRLLSFRIGNFSLTIPQV